jgi:hypothetical protein
MIIYNSEMHGTEMDNHDPLENITCLDTLWAALGFCLDVTVPLIHLWCPDIVVCVYDPVYANPDAAAEAYMAGQANTAAEAATR